MIDILKYVLLTVEVLVGFLLIGVILIQRTKGQGMGLAFGAGMGESLFGAHASDALVKITIILAAVFFFNTMFLARIFSALGSGSSSIGNGAAPLPPLVPGARSDMLPTQPFDYSASDDLEIPTDIPIQDAVPSDASTVDMEAPAELLQPAPILPLE